MITEKKTGTTETTEKERMVIHRQAVRPERL
jgi:hypothetical protein